MKWDKRYIPCEICHWSLKLNIKIIYLISANIDIRAPGLIGTIWNKWYNDINIRAINFYFNIMQFEQSTIRLCQCMTNIVASMFMNYGLVKTNWIRLVSNSSLRHQNFYIKRYFVSYSSPLAVMNMDLNN